MTRWDELDHDNWEWHSITVRCDWTPAHMLRVVNHVDMDGMEWEIPGMPNAHLPVIDNSDGGGWELVDERWSRSRFYPVALFRRPKKQHDDP